MRLRFIASLFVLGALTFAAAAFARPSAVKPPIRITVTMTDYAFKFSRASVPVRSTVIFKVVNKGATVHNVDFVALSKRTPLVAVGNTATLKITFKKKGSFQVVCDVPRHIDFGMISTFRVR